MHDKRYYWLKLEENYFDLKIQKALRKLPSGADMLICYLKMQLKYLNTGGLIEFNNICQNIAEEIALDIDEEIDLVNMTLAMLTKWNVIEVEDESLYLSEMQSRVGSKTDSAVRVAKHREKQKLLQCNTNVTKCNPIKDIDIEKDIDIDNTIYDIVEQELQTTLSSMNYEKINYLIEKYGEDKFKEALGIASNGNKRSLNYVEGILKNNIIKKSKEPEWINKEIKKEELSDNELKELEEMFSEFN